MRAGRSRLGGLAAGALLLVGVLFVPASVIAADGPVTFESPTATSTFPVQTVWRQAFRSPSEPTRVELMTRLAGTETWLVQEVPFRRRAPAPTRSSSPTWASSCPTATSSTASG